jgi:hypothetical protein
MADPPGELHVDIVEGALEWGAVGGARLPRPMSVHCLLSAVGLRNAAAGDIVARPDVGGRRLHPGDNHSIVRERQGDRAAGRFDVQRFALDLTCRSPAGRPDAPSSIRRGRGARRRLATGPVGFAGIDPALSKAVALAAAPLPVARSAARPSMPARWRAAPASRARRSVASPSTCGAAASEPMPVVRSAARPLMPARWRAAPRSSRASRSTATREALDAGGVPRPSTCPAAAPGPMPVARSP